MGTAIDTRRAILDHLPQKERGAFTTTALRLVGRGITDPGAIVAGMAEEYGRRGAQVAPRDEAAAGRADRAGAVLRDHRDQALAFAEWAVSWAGLSDKERAARKAARGEQYRAKWLRQQPVTAKQLDFLHSLGWDGAVVSRGHASELIDALTRPRGQRR